MKYEILATLGFTVEIESFDEISDLVDVEISEAKPMDYDVDVYTTDGELVKTWDNGVWYKDIEY